MPIYEYVCSSCGAAFEKLVARFGDPVACPSCSSAAVDKQLSTFAVATASSQSAPCGMAGADCRSSACGSGACGLLS